MKNLAIFCMILTLPVTSNVFGQTTIKSDCANREVSIPDDNVYIDISEECAEVFVAGENNTITARGIGQLFLMGNNNTVTASHVGELNLMGDKNDVSTTKVDEVYAGGNSNTIRYSVGDEPEHIFMGDGNTFSKDTRTASTTNNNQSAVTTSTSTTAIQRIQKSDLSLPDGFHNIWFIYNRNSGARWTAMTFTDGTITTAVNDTMEMGLADSRKANSAVWGTYQTADSGEQLLVKFPQYEEQIKYFITDRSISIPDSFKLSDCFSSQSFSELGMSGVVGTTAFSSSEYCFDNNGRFSNDSSLAISGSSPQSLGTSIDGKRGNYSISGNIITLQYDNGKTYQALFGAYRFGEPAPAIVAISIGERVLL